MMAFNHIMPDDAGQSLQQFLRGCNHRIHADSKADELTMDHFEHSHRRSAWIDVQLGQNIRLDAEGLLFDLSIQFVYQCVNSQRGIVLPHIQVEGQ